MKKITETFITIRGTPIYYKYIQTDPSWPTLVFVPGGPGFGYGMYEERSLVLAEYVNVLLFDPRGCGKSVFEGDSNEFSLPNHILDLHALISALQLKKIILQGVSYGSIVSLGFAIDYPDLLSKLILITCSPTHKFFEVAKKTLAERGNAEQKAMCEKYLWPGKFDAQSHAEYFTVMESLYSYKAAHGHPQGTNPFKCNPAVINRGFQTEIDHFDFTSRLHAVNCPTLILAGKEDWITPLEFCEIIQRGITKSKLIVFEKASHSLYYDVPEEYNRALINFIAAI